MVFLRMPQQASLTGLSTTLCRIEKISRFLEYHKPHFESNSRSFNYSMPKEKSSGVIGERNSM